MDADSSRKPLPVALGLIALAAFLAHYSLSHGFGLYEDDYWAIAPHLAERPAVLWPILVDCFTSWPQGRPLNHFLPPLLTVIAGRLGGLQAAYALAAAWLTVHGALVFLLARRHLSPAGALATALAYLLFPADSTKVILDHAAQVQGAMLFPLLGAWLWFRGGPARVAAYPVAACALLTYESTFLPFLMLPLLAPPAVRWSVRTWLRHAVGCGLLGALVGAVRLARGESRMVEAAGHGSQMLWRAFSSLGLGPWTSGRMLLRSIPQAWRDADAHGVLSALLFAGVLALALAALGAAAVAAPARAEGAAGAAAGGARVGWGTGWRWTLIAGLAFWAGSYALTLINYPPTQTIGRLTSTHTAAAFGAALVVGALFDGARHLAPRLASTALVAVLASWLLYQHGIQRQFVEAWRLQRRFWQQVVALVPEARGGWTVLVEGRPVDCPGAVFVNSWADVLAYRAIVPAADGQPVHFAHLGRVGDYLTFRRQADGLQWQPEFWGGPVVTIDPDRLALLHDEGGILTRVEEIATPAGRLRSRAPIPPPGPGTPGPGPVAQLLLGR